MISYIRVDHDETWDINAHVRHLKTQVHGVTSAIRLDYDPELHIDWMADALERVAQVIEATYAHDEDGDRVDEEPEASGADVFEMVSNLEQIVAEALELAGREWPEDYAVI